jgi:hypothetical protein
MNEETTTPADAPSRRRTFRVQERDVGRYVLFIREEGQVQHQLILTFDEVKALADACLSGIGWTPYDYRPPKDEPA